MSVKRKLKLKSVLFETLKLRKREYIIENSDTKLLKRRYRLMTNYWYLLINNRVGSYYWTI